MYLRFSFIFWIRTIVTKWSFIQKPVLKRQIPPNHKHKRTRCIFSRVWCFPGNCSPHSSFISHFSECTWRIKSFCQMKSHQNKVRKVLIEDKWSLGATSCFTLAQINALTPGMCIRPLFEASTFILKTAAGKKKVVARLCEGEVWGCTALRRCDLICCSIRLLNCLRPCCCFSGSVFVLCTHASFKPRSGFLTVIHTFYWVFPEVTWGPGAE